MSASIGASIGAIGNGNAATSGANAAQAGVAVAKNDKTTEQSQSTVAEKSIATPDTVSISKQAMREAETARQTGMLQLLGINASDIDQLRQHIGKVFTEQGMDLKIKAGEQEINLLQITPEEASKLVDKDGFFGVEKTSQRLVDIAIGAAGGDVTKLEAMKKGLEQGFAAAKKAFGDWLPDISYATYDAAVKKLDEWAAGQQTPAAAERTV
ncbi:MAG: hypothetical protein LBU39_05515 [Desulfobulbaceae bacterium]|nr:hypothetical protein [Desulfobulbaceae bacterium]